jgi:hypothetical protein
VSDTDFLAETIRQLRGDLEDARRRLASTVMIGQVVERQGEKVRLEFEEKDPSTGKPFRSPMIRRASASGKDGTGHKERNRPALGETMALISPNGEIGKHSRAIPYGPTDESGEPAGDESYPRVFAEGNATVAIKAGEVRVKVGGATLTITDGKLEIAIGGVTWTLTANGWDQTGGHHKHEGKNTGKDHKHGGITPGGSNTDIPSN